MRYLVLFITLLSIPSFLSAAPKEKPHLKATLISETTSIRPGQPVTLAFHFQMDEGWHIYWRNPGDSGQAPSITWILPKGFKAGEILWPFPKRIELPQLADYGYDGELLVMVPVQVPPRLEPGKRVALSAQVKWLVCHDVCIPGQALLKLNLPIRDIKPKPNRKWPSLFAETRKRLPKVLPYAWKPGGILDGKDFNLFIETDRVISKAQFFPLFPNQIENAAPQNFQFSGKSFQLTLKRSDHLIADVKTLDGLLVTEEKEGEKSYWVNIPLTVK